MGLRYRVFKINVGEDKALKLGGESYDNGAMIRVHVKTIEKFGLQSMIDNRELVEMFSNDTKQKTYSIEQDDDFDIEFMEKDE